MKIVSVTASRHYDVMIGSGLLCRLGELAGKLKKPGKAAVISDSNVWPLYGSAAKSSLENAGFEVISYQFPAGEESKNPNTYLDILNFLAENKMTRSDILVALGGGVVGDMAGFAAATFLRGIQYIQVPTSLLAMVDSSVGGKTAIDLPAGKNLVGAFYQPSLVLCDIDSLNTLPADIFADGCAEVIKYGVLYDKDLFAHLAEKALDFDREYVITRCVTLKRDVVAQDEFDTGARMKLNLGHTVGHAVEANSNFTISHGKAVAIGMAVIALSAQTHGICSTHTQEQITEILTKFGLPTKTEYSADMLIETAMRDKKRMGKTVNLIIPEEIGVCCIKPTPVEKLKSIFEVGL